MRLPHLLAFAAAIALTACLPVTTRVPAGSTVGFKPDPALLGSWRARDPDGDMATFIHIVGNDDGSMTAIMVEPPHKGSNGEWSTFRLTAATLGTNHLMNVQETLTGGKPAETPPGQGQYLFLYCAGGNNTLMLYRMDDNATAAAVRAHEIAGETESGQGGDVRITAGEPALDTFLRSPRAAKLFTKELVTLTRFE